jgi:hypothetical protein
MSLAAVWSVVGANASLAAGDWRISQSVSSVTGARIVNIQVVSSNTAHGGLTFPGGAGLQLGCFNGQPVVQFQFGFQIGSKADSEIFYRFDTGPNRRIKPHILRGLESMVIENKSDVARFMGELAKASVLYVMINSLAKGSSAASFNVAGATEAIDLVRTAGH